MEKRRSPAQIALAEGYRATMAGIVSPVSVVSAAIDDRPHATTVSALASLSLQPPMVLLALDLGSQLLAQLRVTRRIGINLLTEGQVDLARAFARQGDAEFAHVSWRLDGGAPRLDGPGGWLLCSVAELLPAGDHVIVLGTVLDAQPAGARPLAYQARRFGTVSAID